MRWTRAVGPARPDTQEPLAQLLAAHVAESRFAGAPTLHQAWLDRDVVPYTLGQSHAVREFLSPFSPAANPDHLQGLVAEYLWHVLTLEDDSAPPLVWLASPKFLGTAPGPDGLSIRQDRELRFTLWEIKKHTGGRVSATVGQACGQLAANAMRYLAEYAAVGQTVDDPALAGLFGRLTLAWDAGDPTAQAGVAVTTSTPPTRCFSRMRSHFPNLTSPDPCHGLLSAIDSFPAFSVRVAEILWTGL